MDQKEWEERLDRAADRVSRVGHVLEDAYEKGKETLKESLDGTTRSSSETIGNANDAASHSAFTAETKRTVKGSPRLGLTLVALGFVWLLNSLGVLNQPIFPIMLIVLGIYFLARAK